MRMERPKRKAQSRRGWPFVIFAALIAAGVFREETLEILYNATLLCFSCMGLGK